MDKMKTRIGWAICLLIALVIVTCHAQYAATTEELGGTWFLSSDKQYWFHTGKLYNGCDLETALTTLEADPNMATTLENIYSISNVHNNTAFLGGITNQDIKRGWFPTDKELEAMQTEDPELYKWFGAINPKPAEDGSIPLSQLREWYIIQYSMILDGTMQQLWTPYISTNGLVWAYWKASTTIRDGYYSRTLAEATAVIQSYLQSTTAAWPFVDCTEWVDYAWMSISERSPYPEALRVRYCD